LTKLTAKSLFIKISKNS